MHAWTQQRAQQGGQQSGREGLLQHRRQLGWWQQLQVGPLLSKVALEPLPRLFKLDACSGWDTMGGRCSGGGGGGVVCVWWW